MIQTTTYLDVAAIRKDFPILGRLVNGMPLVYLDSAATAQRPWPVIEAMEAYYRRYNANIHRGVYTLSEEATAAYEGARSKVAAFIGAKSHRELVFVRNATEAINLVAYTWGRANVGAGDVIVLTELEHHSNLVPWQMLAKEKGARLEFIRIDDSGILQLEDLDHFLEHGRVKLVAVGQVSNALGTINPVREIVRRAHAAGAAVLIDGAQSIPHQAVNVVELGCDFLVFSGHKMLGPTGIGALYGRRDLLEAMPPFMGGGDMIRSVRRHESTWNDVPWKFEAGTPAIAEAIGLGAAVDYLEGLGMDSIRQHERELTAYTLQRLGEVDGLRLYGPPAEYRGGIASFTLGDAHPHDIATILDGEGVAVRAGHHCCQPLMERLNLSATARASLYLYNRREDVDRLVAALQQVKRVFGV